MTVLQVAERSETYELQTAVGPMFAASFDLLATASHGVAQLRQLILSLAIRGKLVPQKSSEGTASDLLDAIREDSPPDTSTAKRKTIQAEVDSECVGVFELPDAWKWSRLGNVANVIRGITFPASEKTRTPLEGRIACLRTTNVQGTIEWDDLLFVKRSFVSRDEQLVCPLDIIMSMANSRELVGKVAMVEELPWPEATIGGFIAILRPRRLNARYLMLLLRTDYARSALIDSSSQTTNIANISLAKLRPLPVPVPPLAEQARIVARVEELMQLCDALEVHGRLQDEQHARLVATLFDALATSASAEELAENWQRIATHFDLLLDRPEAVDALEQTLLQLAVRGLLVPQDPTDEPATELLARIRAEKDQLVAGGQIKRDKLAEIGDEEKELPELPRGWEWASVASIAIVGTGTTPSRTNPAYFSPAAIPWVTSGETGQPFIAKTEQAVSSLALRETNLTVYPSGTLIVAMYGQGKTRGQVSELLIEATTNQACAAIVPVISDAEHRRYLKLFFEKIYDEIRELSAGGAQPNLNVGKVKATLIPLPPLAEQHRIVARVEQLRRLCADLRERQQQARTTQSRLADALVSAAAQPPSC